MITSRVARVIILIICRFTVPCGWPPDVVLCSFVPCVRIRSCTEVSGALPPEPGGRGVRGIYHFTATAARATIRLPLRRIGATGSPSLAERQAVRPRGRFVPPGGNRPERLSGAAAAGDDRSTRSSHLGFLVRLRWPESDTSQGGWGTGPPGLWPQHLGGTHRKPGRAGRKERTLESAHSWTPRPWWSRACIEWREDKAILPEGRTPNEYVTCLESCL